MSDRVIDACLSVRRGKLFFEECDVAELARRFGTPLFLVSEDQLRRNVRRWTVAFAERWPQGRFRLLPSVKANYVTALWLVLKEEGAGADTFGSAEFDVTQRAGVDPALVSVNGQKDRRLLERAVLAGARITVDNLAELPEIRHAAAAGGRPAQVRLRIRPDLLSWTEPTDLVAEEVPTGLAMQVYKPGVPTEQLLALSREDLGAEIDLVGLHLHVARNTTDPAFWALAARNMVEIAARLRQRLDGWTPRQLDLGGGFPSPRDPVGRRIPRVTAKRSLAELAPPPEAYAEAITTALREELSAHGLPADGMLLEVEPGRGMFQDTGIHVATVTRLKDQREPVPMRWVETDTTEGFLNDGNLEHCQWVPLVANRADEKPTQTADVVGCACTLDQIVADAELPDVVVDDVIAILDTGAYQDAAATNFNALPRPATVLVAGDDAAVIKRAETIEDVTGRDVVPDRLLALDGAQRSSRRPA
jgi:diaminopimelate decarboxylase